jgi:hypothetical protein
MRERHLTTARARWAASRLLAIAIVLTPVWPATAFAQQDQAGGAGPSVTSLLPDRRLSPQLGTVAVDGAEYRAAVATWQRTVGGIAEGTRLIERTRSEIAALTAQRLALRTAIVETSVVLDDALAELARRQVRLDAVAVERYVGGGSAVEAIELIDAERANDELYGRTLAQVMTDTLVARRGELQRRIRELERRVAATGAELVATETGLARAEDLLAGTTRRVGELRAALPGHEQAVRDRRIVARVVGADLSLVVLDAYVKAAERQRRAAPGCGIEWWMLAALGRIESFHGTYRGSTVLADGTTSQRIIGIPLDGTNGTRRIEDTDKGLLDGDTVLDRAVGPMQFIPSTWRAFGRDGNGDGVADPHNIYDAAAAAANYLCARSPTLGTTEGLRAAIFAYNRSTSYVDTVMANGRTYQQFSFPAA